MLFIQPSASSVTDTVAILNVPNTTNEVHSITVTCTIHPNSTADQCVVMAMDDGRVISTGNHIDVNLIPAMNMYIAMYVIHKECKFAHGCISAKSYLMYMGGPKVHNFP